jgi:D-proline reductase (dithiol) PrdB
VCVYHLHIDTRFAMEDLNCIFPLQRLLELEAGHVIARSAPRHYSFMGYILQPRVLIEESTPAIVQHLQEDRVDVALLIPVWPVCRWSVGLVQRENESAGIATMSLSNIPDLTASVGVPRLVAIEYPFGRTLGMPNDAEGQRVVVCATLQAAAHMSHAGERVDLPFEWPEPPKRARAHPPQPPPIVQHLRRHPWDLPKLLARDVPER